MHNYICEASDGDMANYGSNPPTGGCPNGFPYLNVNNAIVTVLGDRDEEDRPLFLSGYCDVCVERQDQLRYELHEYQDEPAGGNIVEVPDHHPMQGPRQVGIIQAWNDFGGPHPEDQLLFYTRDGNIVTRRYTNEEWDAIQEEAALVQDRDIYHDDQHTFNPSTYFEYLRTHPEHESNMREHMELHVQMMDEVYAFLGRQTAD